MRLDSARAKLERARVHRSQLLEAGIDWLQRHGHQPLPMKRRIEPWQDGGEVVIYSVGESPLVVPTEVALILGDALSNYRVALDHAAWSLVIANGEPPRPDGVYFPIYAERVKFERAFAGKMPGVSDVTRQIVDRYQPFRNGEKFGDHPLYLLNEWNRFDKHRTLPVVAVLAASMSVELPGEYENFEILQRERARDPEYLTPGMDLVRIYGRRRDPSKDNDVRIKVGGTVTIAHESGRPLELLLERIDKVVDAAITELERAG